MHARWPYSLVFRCLELWCRMRYCRTGTGERKRWIPLGTAQSAVLLHRHELLEIRVCPRILFTTVPSHRSGIPHPLSPLRDSPTTGTGTGTIGGTVTCYRLPALTAVSTIDDFRFACTNNGTAKAQTARVCILFGEIVFFFFLQISLLTKMENNPEPSRKSEGRQTGPSDLTKMPRKCKCECRRHHTDDTSKSRLAGPLSESADSGQNR